MFKSSEEACLRATGEKVVVIQSLPNREVLTSLGTFQEMALRPAHPSVISAGLWESPDVRAKRRQAEWEAEEDTSEYLPFEDRDRVETKLQAAKLKVDYCGHWKGGQDVEYLGFEESERIRISHECTLADLKELEAALDSDTESKCWIPVRNYRASTARCSYCNEYMSETTNGKTLRLTPQACPHPNGFAPLQWELNVPSGRLVVANDLRDWFPLSEGDDHIESVSSTIGCRNTTEEYAANGLAHGFVGNSCPGVYRLAKGSYTIAQRAKGKKLMSSICTDLWWYSICDADEFALRAQRFGSLEDADATVIKVKPGVYQFTQPDRESHDQEVHANFQWIREPDAPAPFLQKWAAVDINAHAYVQAVTSQRFDEGRTWQNLSEEQRKNAWASVALDVLFTREELDLHEKGFPVTRVDPSVPDIDPPELRYTTSWYSFSDEYTPHEHKAPVLAPSFAKLAFRALESLISFGTVELLGSSSDTLKSWRKERERSRKRMLSAVQRYRVLMKVYGQFADPEYVAWLSEPSRAEDWVAQFPLETP